MENSIPDLIYTTFHASVQVNPQTNTFASQVKSLKTLLVQHFHLMKKYNHCTLFMKNDQIEQSAYANGCLHPEGEQKDVTAGCNLDQHSASKLRHGFWNYGSASVFRIKMCQNF